MLERWERERTFEALRDANRGGSAVQLPRRADHGQQPDGRPSRLGPHASRTSSSATTPCSATTSATRTASTARACGSRSRSRGSSGLNSKRDIEAYGLDRFARACRERVAMYAGVQTEQSIRLGQWMDWDAVVLHDDRPQHQLHLGLPEACHERGWLYRGHRSMPWCPRCGTSLSQHELIDSYKDIDPPVAVRAPAAASGATTSTWWCGRPRPGRCRRTWPPPCGPTPTTPGSRRRPGSPTSPPHRREHVPVRGNRARHGAGLRAGRAGPTAGRSTTWPRRQGVEHRVVAWDEVSMDEGTGIVHIAPGCGAEDFELGKRRGSPRSCRSTRPARSPTASAGCTATHTAEAAPAGRRGPRPARPAGRRRRADPPLPGLLALRHRADLPAGGRVVHPLRRGPRADDRGRPRGGVDAPPVRQADGGLAAQHGRLVHQPQALLGPAAAVLLLRRRPHDGDRRRRTSCASGRLRGTERAGGAAPAVDRRGRDRLRRVRRRRPTASRRWATAGWTPASSRSRRWAGRDVDRPRAGYAAGAGEGLTTPTCPTTRTGSSGIPADWVTEMREQIRLWFYSMLFMGVVLDGRAPYRRVLAYEKVNDETGRPMHKSWGNAIWFDDAIEEMGADVMRWMYAAQPPAQNLNFGYGPASRGQAPAADGSGTPTRSSCSTPTSTASRPIWRCSSTGPARRRRGRSTAGWWPRTQELVGECRGGARRVRLAAAGAGLRDVRGRPLQLVRAALAAAVLEVGRRRRQAGRPSRRSGTRWCRRSAASRR